MNCLNFGNPEHPEVMWQLSECIDGMAEACRALSLPVIGGNVSLYNESAGTDIDPTPVLGVLGLVDAVHACPPGAGWSEGDTVMLLGVRDASARNSVAAGAFPLEGTRWATERRGHRAGSGRVAAVDFGAHASLCALVAGLVAARVAGPDAARPADAGLVHAVHDVSGGGLAVALAEMAAAGGVGCTLDLDDPAELFSELPSRIIVATADPEALSTRAAEAGVRALGPRPRRRGPRAPGQPGRPLRRRGARRVRGEPGVRPGRSMRSPSCASTPQCCATMKAG